MRVFMAGGTGAAGIPALTRLVAEGHTVTAVARAPEKAARVRSLGAEPVTVDLFDASGVIEAVRGHDAVVNLATHIPSVESAMRRSAWAENDRIRTVVSANLAGAAAGAGARVFVQESVALCYADGGPEWIDEEAPVRRRGPVASSARSEEAAQRFTGSGGRGIVLRFAQFYGPGSGQTAYARKMLQKGWSPFPGPGGAYLSMIHTEDAGGAAAAALDAPAGIYNVSDDEPMRRRDLLALLADIEGTRRPRTIPTPLLRLAGSRIEPLLRSHRIRAQRFREATGWRPSFPTVREGWRQVIGEAGT